MIKSLKKLLKIIIFIIWILDIINCPFMGFMDTIVPINTLGWFLIFTIIFPLLFDNENFE